jgi:hypothetical protein
MIRHSKEIISEIKFLRKKGYSIPQLMEYFNLPKTTIWHHVQKVKLSDKMRTEIRSRQGGSIKKMNEDWMQADLTATEILQNSSSRELAVKIAMLYWAEESKRQLVFTNTDAAMLRIYIHALKTLLDIPQSAIKLLIRISDPIDPQESKQHWCKELSFKESAVAVDYNNKQTKTKTQYGICRISVIKSGYYHKVIQCMISQLKTPL